MSRFVVVIDVPDDAGCDDEPPRPWTADEIDECVNSFAEGYGGLVVKGPLNPGDWATALVEANAELDSITEAA
jgi:hypothetical protein